MIVKTADVMLVGAGAMSSTLGMMLKQLDPALSIMMVERLDQVAQESTDALNNAGTGHAAYCELNYTPELSDGSIDIRKALRINASFELSLQFWSYLVSQGMLPEPKAFINIAPHQSFVWGEKNVEFLRKRYRTLSQHHQFLDMEFSEDPEVLAKWMPLVMKGRPKDQPVAGTRVRYGSDVNFGELARHMVKYLETQPGFDLQLSHNVRDLNQTADGQWDVELENVKTGRRETVRSRFVFLGAGGAALPLLQKSDIPEGKGYGGFPVSGQWLVCRDPAIVNQHLAKVYGKAPIGAPPMSVPHLDARYINGQNVLLFGPFAGFTTKFLKRGSFMDLVKSVNGSNLVPMLSVGRDNMDLTRYLIKEAMQSHSSRVKALQNFYPEVKDGDWELAVAGQRVQIIKKDPEKGGKLEFGTEVVSSADGSLAALLGASPGASTSVEAMLTVLETCFKDRLAGEWQQKLKTMIPSYGRSLNDEPELLHQVRDMTLTTLALDPEREVETA
ncbi:malate:quinone oxidoreductase [Terasakiispira papahanaumokuakeensis]|uniref:Probable malate:quinone oxidoreductase n=1 Tax=Terasakiispira papahanaumokuakeensis TaxID=197479 RepID=A0A1E2VDQ9_9GAMM|nr:malate dehydrogenase (quinone) [Terasakiispira papahanaumokuakeensis]ODC05111.1 malate:quinone oxidoreductase [Terasakiispira papahanaumokuakeensis]